MHIIAVGGTGKLATIEWLQQNAKPESVICFDRENSAALEKAAEAAGVRFKYDSMLPEGAAVPKLSAALGPDPLGHVAYLRSDLDRTLEQGYFGRPAIGAAELTSPRGGLDGPPVTLLERAVASIPPSGDLAIIGSLAGGTGTSLLPLLFAKLGRQSRSPRSLVYLYAFMPWFNPGNEISWERCALNAVLGFGKLAEISRTIQTENDKSHDPTRPLLRLIPIARDLRQAQTTKPMDLSQGETSSFLRGAVHAMGAVDIDPSKPGAAAAAPAAQGNVLVQLTAISKEDKLSHKDAPPAFMRNALQAVGRWNLAAAGQLFGFLVAAAQPEMLRDLHVVWGAAQKRPKFYDLIMGELAATERAADLASKSAAQAEIPNAAHDDQELLKAMQKPLPRVTAKEITSLLNAGDPGKVHAAATLAANAITAEIRSYIAVEVVGANDPTVSLAPVDDKVLERIGINASSVDSRVRLIASGEESKYVGATKDTYLAALPGLLTNRYSTAVADPLAAGEFFMLLLREWTQKVGANKTVVPQNGPLDLSRTLWLGLATGLAILQDLDPTASNVLKARANSGLKTAATVSLLCFDDIALGFTHPAAGLVPAVGLWDSAATPDDSSGVDAVFQALKRQLAAMSTVEVERVLRTQLPPILKVLFANVDDLDVKAAKETILTNPFDFLEGGTGRLPFMLDSEVRAWLAALATSGDKTVEVSDSPQGRILSFRADPILLLFAQGGRDYIADVNKDKVKAASQWKIGNPGARIQNPWFVM